VSADGYTAAAWYETFSPPKVQLIQVVGDTLQVRDEGSGAGHVVPGPDGRVIFTGRGLYPRDAKPIGDPPSVRTLPAGPRDLYLSFKEPVWPRLYVHVLGQSKPLGTLDDLPNLVLPLRPGEEWKNRRPPNEPHLAPDRRIHLIPAAKLLAYVSEGDDVLYLRR